ncbi:hypothetical protein [Glutamicibacter uratoxydans]|uniref:hypothetical protein n=1 Tax=Glutamicibacter uratoxydans TaxID=43667 RepID=UPI003D6E0ECA
MTDNIERIPFYPKIENNLLYFQLDPSLATIENIQTAMCSVGRVNGPALLFDLFYSGTITNEVLAAVIGGVWTSAEYPERAVDTESWHEMFNAAGYTVDGKPSALPTEPLVLFRGATVEHKAGMCWTDDRAIAERFAYGQLRGRDLGTLWTATVEPVFLLAKINDREESEYVVDTTGLEIRAVESDA